MKPENMDMSTPVTHGELRDEIELLDQKFKQWLEAWAGALIPRMDASEQRLTRRIEAVELRIEDTEQRLTQRIDAVELRIEATGRQLSEERARHTGAILESMAMQIAVIDEKYADLPGRVHRLEGQVFPLQRR